MSKFKKLSKTVLGLAQSVEQNALLLGKTQTEHELEQCKISSDQFVAQLSSLSGDIARFADRAKETDEDKITYGPKMAKKVLDIADVFGETEMKALEAQKSWTDAWSVIEQRRNEERLRQMAEEEQKRQAQLEQERLHRENEELARRKKMEGSKAQHEEAERSRTAGMQVEREMFLHETAEREEKQRKEAEQERLREQQKNKAKDMALDETLEILESNTSREQYRICVRTLHGMMELIKKGPSDPKFRHMRTSNEALKRDLADHIGGDECLLAMGFREKDLTHPVKDTYWVLKEPNISDIDIWCEWFEQIKEHVEILEESL